MSVCEEIDPIEALDRIARRQEQELTAKKRIETVRAKLVLDRDPKRCFFKVVSMQLDCQADWEIETTCVDGKRIRYNPEFVSGLSLPEAQGVICGHEPLHCAFGHHARRLGREPKRWNVACDWAINSICDEAGFALPASALRPGMLPGGGTIDVPKDLSAEEYYAMLPEGAGGGEGDDPGGCGGVTDAAHDAAGNEESAQQWERTTAQAAELAAKQKGVLPGALAKLVENILHPQIPWGDVLRDFVSKTFEARDDFSWLYPNRRYMAQGLLLPGLRSQSIGHLVVAVDTSGSVSDEDLQEFAGELNGILEARPAKVSVIYCDSRIQKVVDWTPSEGPMPLEAVGRGGTSHRPVFEWIDRCDEEPVCAICLTDLETSFPDDPPNLPTLWVVTRDGSKDRPPFGQAVRLN